MEDNGRYRVVVNDEEQYSIWPDGKHLAAGWHDTGVTGSRTDCLDHIERVWTDLRPRSLRTRPARPQAEKSVAERLAAG